MLCNVQCCTSALQLSAAQHYALPFVALSLLIAIGAAVWLATHLRTAHAQRQGMLKNGAALVMRAAICGMHYTGMLAVSFHTTHAISIVGTYVIAENITARVTAEAAVRESEQRYRAMLRDLATPVIPITDTVVVLPIVGTPDLARTQQMETNLRHDLAERRAQVVIIDLTGVPSKSSPRHCYE